MGCFGSRFDKRNSSADDFNTVGLQYVGGASQTVDKCPLDKVCMMYGDSKEVEEWLKVGPLTMTAQEEGEKIAKEAWAALQKQHKHLNDTYGSKDKTVYVNGKFPHKDAIADIEGTMAFLKEKNPDIEFPEPAKAEEAPAMEGDMMAMEGEMMAEEMMEGGDEMEMMMEKEDLYKDDSEDYTGFANLPKLFLRCMTVHPYFGDLIKKCLIYYEFNFGDKALVPLPKIDLFKDPRELMNGKHTEDKEWAGVAALVGCALDAAEAADTEVWFSGYLGDEDLEQLKEIAEGENVLFPGWVAGWKTKEEAIKNIWENNGKNKVHKVVIHTNTKCASAVVCRLFAQRFNSKKKTLTEVDGIWELEVEDDSWEYKTLADWKTKMEELAKAEAEAAAAAAMMEGEKAADMMEGEMAPAEEPAAME